MRIQHSIHFERILNVRLRLAYFQFHTFCSIALFGFFPRTLHATCYTVFFCFPDDWFSLSFKSIKINAFDVIWPCVEHVSLLLCFLNPHKWLHLWKCRGWLIAYIFFLIWPLLPLIPLTAQIDRVESELWNRASVPIWFEIVWIQIGADCHKLKNFERKRKHQSKWCIDFEHIDGVHFQGLIVFLNYNKRMKTLRKCELLWICVLIIGEVE